MKEVEQSIDKSKHQNHGTISGATWSGNELTFDGINDEISCAVANLYPVAEFSFEAWIKPTALVAPTGIMGDNSSNYRAFVVSTNNRIQFYVQASNGSAQSATMQFDMSLGIWHHIVGTYKRNDKIKLYVDANLVDVNNTFDLDSRVPTNVLR